MSITPPAYIVSEENRIAFEIYREEIYLLTKEGKDVPRDLVLRFILTINSTEDLPENFKDRSQRIQKANENTEPYTQKVLKYLLSENAKKHYNFSGTRRAVYYKWIGEEVGYTKGNMVKKTYRQVPYSLENLVHFCIWQYIIEAICKSKKEATEFFMQCIDDYVASTKDKKVKKQISDYKRLVIAGHLTNIASGFKLISGKDISNEAIYQAVRNTLRSKK